ncbi:MAG: hypothetical protein ACM30I_01825 [Gemmatimonas sp.]
MTEVTTTHAAPAATPAPTAASATAPATTADWSASFDADARALVAAKGWRSPADALRSYAHLERLMGGDRIAVPAADAAPDAWEAVYAKLGRPANADGYRLQRPEGFDGYSEDLAAGFRQAAFAAGLSDRQARTLHDFYVATAAERADAEAEQAQAASAALDRHLRATWGPQYEANVALARRAARAFAPPETLDALHGAMDAPAVLALFARIGAAMGEDRLVGDGDSSHALAPEQARSEIARIEGQMTDPRSALMDRSHPEHDTLVRRRDALYRLAFPG